MGLGWQELLIVLFIVLLLFGSTKLPQLMRSLGQGVGEFKTGMKEPPARSEDEQEEEEANKA
ncbi:MAG: twin-arginine translocase TatA/TatE family subunit [Blastopirellula sp. JB062]